ncbi:MAG: hypothetical protein R2880_05460 [Deinococcales bacterium]
MKVTIRHIAAHYYVQIFFQGAKILDYVANCKRSAIQDSLLKAEQLILSLP